MAAKFPTQIVPTDLPPELVSAVSRATEILLAGGVVALPTETVYGLAANAFNDQAVAAIFAIKERPSFDPLIVHIHHREHLNEVAQVPAESAVVIEKLAREFWPGPLTLILLKHPRISDLVTSGLPTVAVRVPAHPVMRRVLKACGFPLAAPSANRFGRISPTTAQAVHTELGGRIPLILDGGACAEGIESTILHVSVQPKTGHDLLEIVRAGPITREMLKPFGVVKKGTPERQATAPGQLASHYAPRTPVRLLGNGEVFSPEEGRRYGLLSLTGEPETLRLEDFAVVEVLSPGTGKLQEAAIRLFAMLRRLDEAGVDEIIAEPVAEMGLGVAVMDRLRKAAGKG